MSNEAEKSVLAIRSMVLLQVRGSSLLPFNKILVDVK